MRRLSSPANFDPSLIQFAPPPNPWPPLAHSVWIFTPTQLHIPCCRTMTTGFLISVKFGLFHIIVEIYLVLLSKQIISVLVWVFCFPPLCREFRPLNSLVMENYPITILLHNVMTPTTRKLKKYLNIHEIQGENSHAIGYRQGQLNYLTNQITKLTNNYWLRQNASGFINPRISKFSHSLIKTWNSLHL